MFSEKSLKPPKVSARGRFFSKNRFFIFRPIIETAPETPLERFKRLVKALIVQHRWTRLRQKMADEDQMIKVHQMDDLSNPDVLTFNPGGMLLNFI